MNKISLKGIICAMVTPFDNNKNINLNSTKKLIEQLIEKGISGIFILGTNGEFHVLTDKEKIFFAEFVIKTVNHRVPVFVGTGSNSTKQTIELSKKMEKLGADALSIITPFLIPLSQRELVEYYKEIAQNISIPIILYNIPKNTGVNIEKESVAQLAKIDNIIGIKDSSGKIENIADYISVTKEENFAVLSGSDSLILKALKVGAAGAVASTSNLLTDIDVNIYKDFSTGKIGKAEEKQNSIERLRAVLKLATVPAIIKRALTLSGIDVGPASLPVLQPNQGVDNEIRKMLDSYKIKHN